MTTPADIHAAPMGAVYICAHPEQVKYLRETYTRRQDLCFVSVDWLLSQSWHSTKVPAIVVDPYAQSHMTSEHMQALSIARAKSVR